MWSAGTGGFNRASNALRSTVSCSSKARANPCSHRRLSAPAGTYISQAIAVRAEIADDGVAIAQVAAPIKTLYTDPTHRYTDPTHWRDTLESAVCIRDGGKGLRSIRYSVLPFSPVSSISWNDFNDAYPEVA